MAKMRKNARYDGVYGAQQYCMSARFGEQE
jgi:hypothetical protein